MSDYNLLIIAKNDYERGIIREFKKTAKRKGEKYKDALLKLMKEYAGIVN